MPAAVTFKKDPRVEVKLAASMAVYLAHKVSQVEREAKRLAPVKTGNLRRSITSGVAGGGLGIYGYCAATAHYGGFVEFGTRYMGPRPFLRPALAKVLGRSG